MPHLPPALLLSAFVALTVFSVMFSLGLSLHLREVHLLWFRPRALLPALFCVLVLVPVLAITLVTLLDLPHEARLGIGLMALAPGAPISLRRALQAGGTASFALGLQISVCLLAVVTLPLSLFLLGLLFPLHATIPPLRVAQQVFLSQLLALGLGLILACRYPAVAARLERPVSRAANLLFLLLPLLILFLSWRLVFGLDPLAVLAILLITVAALTLGHLLGGPDPGQRTALALSAAVLRNPGLALLVATFNVAEPGLKAVIVAYVFWAALPVTAYAVWRGRRRDSRRTEK